MKPLTKISAIVVPSLAPFLIFSFLAKGFNGDFSGDQSHAIDIVYSLVYFYHFALPLLAIAAILSQYLIVLPVWNRVMAKTIKAKLIAAFLLILMCAIASFAFSYSIWDSKDGTSWLIDVTLAVTIMQLIYWFTNLLILTSLHITTNKNKSQKDTPATDQQPKIEQ